MDSAISALMIEANSLLGIESIGRVFKSAIYTAHDNDVQGARPFTHEDYIRKGLEMLLNDYGNPVCEGPTFADANTIVQSLKDMELLA